jgi:bifunctional non-homologous end joining protein LigD
MGLDEYNRKRNFGVTSEPPGKEPTQKERDRTRERAYVIQKHAARQLHYDFRLELDGVLKSWSVPKGPSLDPKVKRLAMQTEDHPLEYGGFEGIIPAGEYGGGTVLLWDTGTWEPQGNPHQEFAAGNFKFILKGEKLHGKWALIRIGGRGPAAARGRGQGDDRAWLLIKERDEEARPEAEVDIAAARPESVASQRSLEEIAGDRSRVWHSDRQRVDPRKIPGAVRAELPARVTAAQATRRRAPPTGDGWLHEMEIDGDRLLARVEKGEVRFLSGRGTALGAAAARRLTPVADAVRMLPAEGLIVDGVLTALSPDGRAHRAGIDDALAGKGEAALTYYLDDLLFLDGHDLRPVPLARRKALLAELVARVREAGPLRYAQHIAGDGAAFHDEACRLGIPGMLSRRADAPYPGPPGSRILVSCDPPPT